jgi:hypothetical protein
MPVAFKMRYTAGMVRIVLLLLGCVCAACGGSGGLERALATGDVNGALAVYRAEREREALRQVAEHVLVADARAADAAQSGRAWALLRGLGAAGLPAWSQLEREPGDHFVARVRAHALAARAALGDAPARRALRALLEHDDHEVVALAVVTLDAESDTAQLRALAADPSASVRGAAVQQLARAPAETATLDLLSSRARIDPVQSVRASAARALVAQGAPAIDALEALCDEAESGPITAAPKTAAATAQRAQAAVAPPEARDDAGAVRVQAAALAALFELSAERATPRIAALLAGTPGGLSLQVAQDVLARRDAAQQGLAPAALAHLAHALGSAGPSPNAARIVRERAALAVTTAAAHPAARAALLPAVQAQLAVERDRPARLLLAIAQQRLTTERDRRELLDLARGQDIVAAQAAAELAPHNSAARERLSALGASPDRAVRAAAATASAASFDFDRAPSTAVSLRALAEPEPRLHAPVAAALLRAIERLQTLTGS